MAITLTDEMLEVLQGMEKEEARGFLRGLQMAQMGGGGRPTAGQITALPAPAPAKAPPVAQPPAPRKSNYRGAQAEIMRLLFTGPAGYIQLQESSRYPRLVVVRVISQLRRQGDLHMLRSANGQEVWELTPQGRAVASHYVQNPGLKVLNRQRMEKAGQALDKVGRAGPQ